MNITFKEKSLLIQFAAIVLATSAYASNVLPKGDTYNTDGLLSPFIIFVFVIVIINIVGHIAASVFDSPEVEDERDELVVLKASKAKAMILSSGIVLSVLLTLKLGSEFWTIQALLAFLIAGEVVEILASLFFYRRGF